MERVYLRFDIEPSSPNDGYAVCEFVDGVPTRQASVVGERMVSSLTDSDPEVGPTPTELLLTSAGVRQSPKLREVDRDYFERLWTEATSQ